MSVGALEGVSIVGVGSSLASLYCVKLLTDLGASAVLVEPAGGHPLRTSGSEASRGVFANLATNCRSYERTPAGDTEVLRSLVSRSNILVTDGAVEAVWLAGWPVPSTVVHVQLTPFGRFGRYADWKPSEIALWAMGGFMYFSGEKTRPPLLLPGDQAEYHAGMHGALAALAALHDLRATGFGQGVEVSAVEATLAAHNWLTTMWSHGGKVQDRTTQDLIRCSDGWVSFMQLVRYPNLFILIDQPHLMDDPRWADAAGWAQHNPVIYGMVSDWCSSRTRREIISAAQELRIACAPVNDVSDLARSQQLRERGWWLGVDREAYGVPRLPGFPYRFTATPPTLSRPSPRRGQHNSEIESELDQLPGVPQQVGVAPRNYRLLQGIRVVEVTNNWAGPVAGRHLGDMGADVIKVESPTRPATRGGIWPNNDPQAQPYNRSGYFNEMNRNKRDLVLDLAQPAGRAAFLDLIKSADILIENNSARVMPNLGLAYDDLQAVNPRLIMVSISAFGASGPERDFVAYGSNIEASCGLASLLGYDDTEPYRTSSYYADPIGGAHAAIAALAALEHRRSSGRGQWIDISLNEVGATFFAAALLEFEREGRVPRRRGNRDERYVPQGAYRCAGIDNWVGLSVQSDEEWRALCHLLGREDLAADESLSTLAGRSASCEMIDEAITAWTMPLEQYEAAWQLQGSGISAAPVLASWQFLSDPHLHERNFFVEVEQPLLGVYRYTGWPWKFDRTPAAVSRHAPLFGEHNDELFRELGLEQGAIQALYDSEVTANRPLGP